MEPGLCLRVPRQARCLGLSVRSVLARAAGKERSDRKLGVRCEALREYARLAFGPFKAQPTPYSQQPPSLLLSVATGNSLLLGFVGAWLPGGCG